VCTLSIIPNDGQLIVTMNRDESRDRPQSDDMRVTGDAAYPYDAEKGGTWFGVNRHGLVLALLNYYDGHQLPQQSSAPSRGRFIPALLSARSIDEALEKFAGLLRKDDKPFNLVLTSKDRMMHVQWNGKQLSRKDLDAKAPFFLTSTSQYAAEAFPLRQKLFNDFLQSHPVKDAAVVLRDLHLKSLPGQENISIFMQREKRHTKSITQAALSSAGVAVTYYTEGQLPAMAKQGADLGNIPALKARFEFQKPPAASLKNKNAHRPH